MRRRSDQALSAVRLGGAVQITLNRPSKAMLAGAGAAGPRVPGTFMRSLTFNEKRCVLGIYLVVFLFAVANRYMEWGILGRMGAPLPSVMMLVGLVAYYYFGPAFLEQMDEAVAARRVAEAKMEDARDKSNDPAESARVRRDIGIPPD